MGKKSQWKREYTDSHTHQLAGSWKTLLGKPSAKNLCLRKKGYVYFTPLGEDHNLVVEVSAF